MELIQAINIDDWDAAQKMLNGKENFHHVNVTASFGRNPLHEACRHHDTPFELVQSLLCVFEDSPLVQDDDGLTPLHCATVFSSDRIILELVKYRPRALLIENKWGWTPLHYAIYWDRSIEVLEAFVEALEPSSITSKNKLCDSPLNLFFQKWNLGLRTLLNSVSDEFPEKTVLDFEISDQDYLIPKTSKVRDIYDKTVLLMKKAFQGAENTSFQALHTSVKVECCPWSFISLIRRVNPEQISQRDGGGNLPIHIAASSKTFTEVEMSDIISELVASYPQAASLPDNNGRLPLQLAIANGQSFHKGPLKSLLYAAPHALNRTDKETNLFPFMLAAAKNEQKLSDKKLDQLTTIYLLLKEDPTLVSRCTYQTSNKRNIKSCTGSLRQTNQNKRRKMLHV